MANVEYPQVKKVLTEAFELLKRKRRGLTLRKAAQEMDVSPAALSAWLAGQRAPREANIDKKLAPFFFPTAGPERDKFIAELAAPGRAEATAQDPFDPIVAGVRGVRVGIVEYGRFAEGGAGFLDHLIARFLAFAGLREEPSAAIKLEDVPDRLTVQNSIDIAVSILATVDRTLRMRFFNSPIRIALNAVFLNGQPESPGRRREDIKREIINALSVQPRLPPGRKRSDVVYPLIQKKEIGGLYVLQTLGFDELDTYGVVTFDRFKGLARAYAEALAATSSGSATPVAVLDEYSCALIVKELKGRGDFVFPLNGTESRSQPGERLPKYPLGIAVNRLHEKWIGYLADAFALHLDADAEDIASLYAQLRQGLIKDFSQILKSSQDNKDRSEDHARKWVDSALGWGEGDLDRNARLDSAPALWRHVLLRAREIAHQTEKKGETHGS